MDIDLAVRTKRPIDATSGLEGDPGPAKKMKLDFQESIIVHVSSNLQHTMSFSVPCELAMAHSRTLWHFHQTRWSSPSYPSFRLRDPTVFNIVLQFWYTTSLVLAADEEDMDHVEKWATLVDVYNLSLQLQSEGLQQAVMDRVRQELETAALSLAAIEYIYSELTESEDPLRGEIVDYIARQHDATPWSLRGGEEALDRFMKEYQERLSDLASEGFYDD